MNPLHDQPYKRLKVDTSALVLSEKWDAMKLSHLINAATRAGPSFDAGALAKMKRIYGELSDAGELEVTYRHSSWITEAGHKFGRTYGNGYQSVRGAVRRICGEEFYYDLDMVNAHFVLLKGLCDRYEIPCPHLSHYVENREACLKKINGDRKKAKESYFCVLFGADIQEHSPLYALSKEFTTITDKLWVMDQYQTIRDACIPHIAAQNAKHPEDQKNVKSTFLSHVLGHHEFMITKDNIRYVQGQKFTVGTNAHDGKLVEKETIGDLDAVLRGMEEHTLKTHGFHVRYVQKSMTPTEEDLAKLWHPFNDYRQTNSYVYERVLSKIDRIVAELNANESLTGDDRVAELSKRTCELFNMVFACVSGVKPTVQQREVVAGVIRYKERSQDDFLKMYGNDTIRVLVDQDPKKGAIFKEISPAKLWMKSRSKLKYARVVFNATPHGEPRAASPDELNLFQGLKLVPTKMFTKEEMDNEVWRDDIGPFLDHVLNGLCRGDNALFDYVIRWLALTVLKPWQKLRQCVVLQAEEGSGKGTLVDIIKKCIGEQYVTAPPTLEEALEGFNASYVDTCLLMFLDEAFFGGSKKINGGLKKLISEPYVASREKFRENRSVQNNFNIIMASNEDHVVQSHKNSRRHIVLNCSNAMAGSCSTKEQRDYFANLRATKTQTLVNYFNSLNMDDWDADNIPQTAGTSMQKEYSLAPYQQFVMDFLADPSLISSAKADGDSKDDLEGFYRLCMLYDVFKVRSGRGNYIITQTLFTRQLAKLVGADGTEKKIEKQRAVLIPTLMSARAAFRNATGITHDVFLEDMEEITKG